MTALLRLFLDLCRLRAAPQDLPSATALAGWTAGLYTAVSALAYRMLYPMGSPLLAAVADALVLIAFVLVALRVTGKPARAAQTLSALFGASIVFALLLLALLGWAPAAGADGTPSAVASIRPSANSSDKCAPFATAAAARTVWPRVSRTRAKPRASTLL